MSGSDWGIDPVKKKQLDSGNVISDGNPTSQPLQSGNTGNSIISGGVSTAGVGKGGTGGWTPIQAYLKANAGTTGSANALQSTAQKAFESDKSRMDSQASQAKQGYDQAKSQQVGKDQASQMVEQYAQGNGNLSQVQNYLNGSYQAAPVDLTQSAQTQQYGKGVSGDRTGFKAIMNTLYNQGSQGRMGAGMKSLQGQLDQDNAAVNTARSNLANQYAGINQASEQYADLNAQMGQLETDYRDGQTAVKNQLGTDATNWENAYNYAAGYNADEVVRPPADGGTTATPGGFRDPASRARAQNKAAQSFNAIMEALGRPDRKELVPVPDDSVQETIGQQIPQAVPVVAPPTEKKYFWE
jgi:hypothetical protein